MGFINGININIQGNLPKTYSLTSWLRQQSTLIPNHVQENLSKTKFPNILLS